MMKNKITLSLPFIVAVLLILISVSLVTQQTEASGEAISSTNLNWENGHAITNNTNSPLGAIRPSLAVSNDGRYLIVAYMKVTGAADGQTDPYVQYSTNYGKNWTINPTPIRVSNDLSKFVAITIDQNNRGHAVWTEKNKELWYGKETSGGTYSVKSIHSIAGLPTDIISPPNIITYGNNVYVVWSQSEIGPTDLYFRRSLDGGNTFQGAVKISNVDGLSLLPDIKVNKSGHLHIAWRQEYNPGGGSPSEDRIYYSTSTNSGANWSTPIPISSAISVSPDAVRFNQPDIQIQDNNVLVTFENRASQNNQNVYVISCATNCGSTVGNWSGQKVSTVNYSVKNTDPAFLNPQIILSGSCPVVFFSSMDLTNPVVSKRDTDEHIRTSSGCESWAKNATVPGVEATLGTNVRAILPSAASANGWFIHLAFERKATSASPSSHIYVTRNIPGVYLPVILK